MGSHRAGHDWRDAAAEAVWPSQPERLSLWLFKKRVANPWSLASLPQQGLAFRGESGRERGVWGYRDWPGAQEGVCWPKPEIPMSGARGQLIGPSSSGFSHKPLTCLQLPTSLRMNLSRLTASWPRLFSPRSSGSPASTCRRTKMPVPTSWLKWQTHSRSRPTRWFQGRTARGVGRPGERAPRAVHSSFF